MSTSEKDTFNGAMIAYRNYFCYVQTLIEEVGMEKAFALMTKSDRARGIQAGKEMREATGGQDLDIETTMHTIIDMAAGIGGIDTILECNEKRAVTVTAFGKCPIYEAAHANGMDDETIETMCRASSLVFLDNVVRQLNPELTYQVSSFRSEEYGGCVEEIVRISDT